MDLLHEITSRAERPADGVANAYFRSRRFIGGGDRRAVADRAWSILRHYGQLLWWLDKTRHPDMPLPSRQESRGIMASPCHPRPDFSASS